MLGVEAPKRTVRPPGDNFTGASGGVCGNLCYYACTKHSKGGAEELWHAKKLKIVQIDGEKSKKDIKSRLSV